MLKWDFFFFFPFRLCLFQLRRAHNIDVFWKIDAKRRIKMFFFLKHRTWFWTDTEKQKIVQGILAELKYRRKRACVKMFEYERRACACNKIALNLKWMLVVICFIFHVVVSWMGNRTEDRKTTSNKTKWRKKNNFSKRKWTLPQNASFIDVKSRVFELKWRPSNEMDTSFVLRAYSFYFLCVLNCSRSACQILYLCLMMILENYILECLWLSLAWLAVMVAVLLYKYKVFSFYLTEARMCRMFYFMSIRFKASSHVYLCHSLKTKNVFIWCSVHSSII